MCIRRTSFVFLLVLNNFIFIITLNLILTFFCLSFSKIIFLLFFLFSPECPFADTNKGHREILISYFSLAVSSRQKLT